MKATTKPVAKSPKAPAKTIKVSRTEIAKAIASSSSLTASKSRVLLDSVIVAITAFIQEGKDVELRGFAHFRVKHVPARKARNPRTGAPVSVAARRKVVVKASPKLLAAKASA
jgi:nucleoid DNA-binding protein